MNRDMATLDTELPPHCQAKKRAKGRYYDVYFMPHPKDRPSGWPATMHMGRTDKATVADIVQKANEVYEDYVRFLDKTITGEDLKKKTGTLVDVISKYKASGFWTDLSKKTRQDYDLYLKEIESWSAEKNHPHIREMTTKSIVKWLGKFEETPVRQRRARTALSILYEVAKNEGYVEHNLARGVKLRKRKTAKRGLMIWEDRDIEIFCKTANDLGFASLGRAVVMGIETAQRKGDIIKMQKPRDYDNGRLRFRQSKTGKLIDIKATDLLKKALEDIPATQLVLFLNERTGKPWSEYDFTHRVREIADLAGLKEHIFMHLRHSSILYLHRAGVDVKGIASITGHSLKTINAMLENHYLETRDREIADKTIEKLERYRKSQTKRVRQKSDKI
jgi:site-specific recombinase XerD